MLLKFLILQPELTVEDAFFIFLSSRDSIFYYVGIWFASQVE